MTLQDQTRWSPDAGQGERHDATGRTSPFTGRDVPWLLDSQAARRPDKTFLVWEPFSGARRSWNYAGFAAETRAYAAGLLAHGVTAEDIVVLHLENCPEFLFFWHACARVGALVVTTNTNSSVDELR